MGDLLAKAGRPFSLMDVTGSTAPGRLPSKRKLLENGYAAAVDCTIRMVRLTADADIIRKRLRGRYSASQRSALEWHLERCDEIAARLEAAGLDELVIDTSTLGPQEVAERTLRHFGLLES